ncbi:hypothetical protein V8E54_008007 [Elaphomyces granulatus]
MSRGKQFSEASLLKFSKHEQLIEAPYPVPNSPHCPHTLLRHELSTPVLDSLYDSLHYVARRSSAHIDSLSDQKIKGRRIIITENPALHLVWHYNVIYIKPIPAFLCNWEFWRKWVHCSAEHFECACNFVEKPDNDKDKKRKKRISMQTEWCARANALGFIRTYAFLIQYPSDFKIALEEGLLPTTTTTSNINYDSFSSFIA